jgi:hypothetical protein
MERDNTQAAPANRRSNKYVYFDWATPNTMVTAYPVPKATSASGFGGVDVFTGGAGDNFAVWTAHTPIWFALDGGAGQGNFTNLKVTTTGELDPEIAVDDARQVLWLVNSGKSGSRTRYWMLKSTDYGTSWTNVDSNLCTYGPQGGYRAANTLDVPILVAPNGNVTLVTGIGADEALPPIGTAHTDSAGLFGYFNSINAGTSWTWTTISKNGEKFVFGTDTLYWLSTNFGQFSAVYDKDNKLHIAAFGYFLKYVNDTTTQRYFGTLYWKTGMTQAKLISNTTDLRVADYDTHPYSGNALGFAYQSIACDPAGPGVFAIWSQPRVTGGKVDTTANGFTRYDLWYAFSNNSGDKWSAATKLANTDDALFATLAPKLSKPTTLTYRAQFTYIKDTTAGSYVFGESGRAMVPIIYRALDYSASGVENEAVARAYALEQNYPNPFNPSTKISYTIGRSSIVTLKVYNIIGQEVATLVNGLQQAGSHSVVFDASKLTTGVYMYKIQAGDFVDVKKMVLMK